MNIQSILLIDFVSLYGAVGQHDMFSIISLLTGLAALALAPKGLPSSLLLFQPEARLSEGTLHDNLVFISPRTDAEVSQFRNQLNMQCDKAEGNRTTCILEATIWFKVLQLCEGRLLRNVEMLS